MKTFYIITIFILFFLVSCLKTNKSDTEYSIFIKNKSMSRKDPLFNINGQYIYFQNSIPAMNTLFYRELNNQEKDSLILILEKLDFNIIDSQYIENVFGAKFDYTIFIIKDKEKKAIKIFQDSIPFSLNELIVYIEKFNPKSNCKKKPLIKVNSKIKGIDNFICSYHIKKIDTVKLSLKNKFFIWKELMLYNGETKPIKNLDTILFDNKINGFYFWKPVKDSIEFIAYKNKKIYLKYKDGDSFYLEDLFSNNFYNIFEGK